MPPSVKSRYVSRRPDAAGRVAYSEEENAIWAELYARQKKAVAHAACEEFLQGLELLKLPEDRVPQLPEVSAALRRATGWEVAPVPALIELPLFFSLLAQRKFPAATFMRRREDLDYLQEPDLFHELFGHTPLLTHPHFAEFTEAYGKLGLAANDEERVYLARLYWFTAEFGLIQKARGPLRIYGGGILSSIGETDYALHSDRPQRKRFDLMDVLRTPYRIDILQPLYYVIEDLRELYELARLDLLGRIAQARRLGLYAPLFPPEASTDEASYPPRLPATRPVLPPDRRAA
ncbi:MAG: phenylalanine 4-monooxygenase [Nevskia sp.]|nr:phenylalanine 4-monooxygenase [Nevskia sp.]